MKQQFALLGVLVAIALVFIFIGGLISPRVEPQTSSTDPYRATLSGVQVCLPHKDTSGPQTLECALGLKTDSGEYYALNLQMLSQEQPVIPNGARVTANGLVTPIENLSSDRWQRYNVKGIFSVTDSVVVEGDGTAQSPLGETGNLNGTWTWIETKLGDGKTFKPKKAGAFTLAFGSDGQITGTTDCNRYFGGYNVGSDGVISMPSIGATKMYCEGSEQGTYINQLAEVSRYAVAGDTLSLTLKDNGGVMVFKKN